MAATAACCFSAGKAAMRAAAETETFPASTAATSGSMPCF
jgi:hypothetical protein